MTQVAVFSVTVFHWLDQLKETSPLIVVIHHLAAGTHENQQSFYSLHSELSI